MKRISEKGVGSPKRERKLVVGSEGFRVVTGVSRGMRLNSEA